MIIDSDAFKELKTMGNEIADTFIKLLEKTAPLADAHVSQHIFKKLLLEGQYLKIYEEVAEAHTATVQGLSEEEEEEEHMDVLFAYLTLMHLRCPGRAAIEEAILRCMVKFHDRGWI